MERRLVKEIAYNFNKGNLKKGDNMPTHRWRHRQNTNTNINTMIHTHIPPRNTHPHATDSPHRCADKFHQMQSPNFFIPPIQSTVSPIDTCMFWRTRGRRVWLSTSHPSAPLGLVDKPHLPTALPPSSEITNAGPWTSWSSNDRRRCRAPFTAAYFYAQDNLRGWYL